MSRERDAQERRGVHTVDKKDYEGFHTRPMRWETVVKKFVKLSESRADKNVQNAIVDAVAHLDEIQVADLTSLLTWRNRPGSQRISAELHVIECLPQHVTCSCHQQLWPKTALNERLPMTDKETWNTERAFSFLRIIDVNPSRVHKG